MQNAPDKREPVEPWAITAEEAVTTLGTSVQKGLSEEEARRRLSVYGANVFLEKEKIGVFSIFFKQFLSPLIFLLIGAAFITGFLNEWVNTAVISLAVLLNVSLGFWNEYQAEHTLEKLSGYIKDRSRVIRGGKEEETDSSLLVPGDIVKLSYGSRVPADIRLLSVNNFQADEAVLTGESIPVSKSEDPVDISAEVAEQKNMAHSGTLSVQGFATGVVCATGSNTEIGKIAGIVSKINRVETPLSRGVSRLAWLIFGLVLVIMGALIVLGISRGEPLLTMLVLSAAIAVGAVPESLPIVLTVILSIGSARIAEKKGVVRKLSAAETLGSATLIMTDKTGTLTQADMQLTGVYSAEDILSEKASGKSSGPDAGKDVEEAKSRRFSPAEINLLRQSILNLDVRVENPEEEKSKWKFLGRPFEVNIARACLERGISLSDIVSSSSSLVLPFNSTNKFSVSAKDGSYAVMGAPDILLKRSKISKEDYLKLESWIEKTSAEGKRLIGLATFPKKEGQKRFSPDEAKDMKFLGCFVFFDPPRPEVAESIKNIESHGVKMVLVTGDLKGTAVSLARDIGWKVGEEEVITGADLRALKDEELLPVLPKLKIFARVTPEDKFRIGVLYRKLGEVVAMTGDGVNDAPALKAMDIGISLGSGSDVAKSAADLVLLDDNFHTVSMAIEEGRKILANIRKAVIYLMSGALDEIFIVGGSLLFSLPLPLTAMQIIWVNLFTESLPALAFAFDENMDHEKYAGKDLKLIFSNEVKLLCFGVGIFTSTLLFVLYDLLDTYWRLPLPQARSVFFVCFSSYILFIAFSFRSLHKPIFSYNPFSNKRLNWSIGIAVAILIATMTVPFLRNAFGLVPLPVAWIPLVLVWILLNVLLMEGAKFLFRRGFFGGKKKRAAETVKASSVKV